MSTVRIIAYDKASDFEIGMAESLFYSRSWISILRSTYGFKVFTAFDTTHRTHLHFALVDNVAGKKLVSLPFSDYTDIQNHRPDRYLDLINAMKAKFPDTPILLKTVGNIETKDEHFVFGKVKRNALYHRIAINPDTPATDVQSSSFRRNVRKAKKTGVKIEIKRDILALTDFYAMYHELRLNKFGSIPQPFGFFETIFKEFLEKEKGFLVEASYEKSPIASILVLQYDAILYYKFGASTEASLDLRPNNLIFDTLITYAQTNGFKAIDLGLSGTGDSYMGLVRFKESMGGVPTPITYYRLSNGYKYSERDAAVKKWLGSLTETIVSQNLEPSSTSALSETIYSLFA